MASSGRLNGRSPSDIVSGPQEGRRKLSPADFYFGSTLGEGAYARVVHAKRKDTGAEFAVKIIEQRFIKKENKVKFVMMEKNVLSTLHHPMVVKLHSTFKDKAYLFFVMELCRGGELLDVISKAREAMLKQGLKDTACSLEVVKFFMAEVIVALKVIHTKGIIHRDLKPENILLDEHGHIKLADFGTAKIEKDGRSNTFVGTAEYVSPEVLRDQEADKSCDLWAVGCMVYQMFVGRPLFRGDNEYLTFQMILEHPAETFRYPPSIPPVAQDLISQLLKQDARERLGGGPDDGENGYPALMAHPFFQGIRWDQLLRSRSPYKPTIKPLSEPRADGSREDWMYAGLATELIEDRGSLSPKQMLAEKRSYRAPPPPAPAPLQKSDSVWSRFLEPNEEIMFNNLVSKRRGLFSKKRQLILTSTPRLLYIDPHSLKKKGEIPWSDSLYVHIKNDNTFDICTPSRNYHFCDSDFGSQRWESVIRSTQLKVASRK